MYRLNKNKGILVCFSFFIAACVVSCAPSSQQVSASLVVDLEALSVRLDTSTDVTGMPLLNNPTHPDAQQLSQVYGVDVSLAQESLICFDKDYNFYILLSPAQGKDNDVKNNLFTALENLETQLELYAPSQSARVDNRLETKRGDYLIYLASADNEALLAEIDAAMNTD